MNASDYYSVTSCQVPRMAVLAVGPDNWGGTLDLPPASPTKDKRYAILADPSDGCCRWVDITGGVGADEMGYNPNEILVAEVEVPRGTTAIMNCHIHRPFVAEEAVLYPEPAKQLVVEFMDGEFRYYKLEGSASWAKRTDGLMWREKQGASRTHIPWHNVRSYSLDLPRRDPDGA